MARKKKQEWAVGDYFLIELADKSFAMGQILAREPLTLMNGPACALFTVRFKSEPFGEPPSPSGADVVSVLFVTRDLLDSGRWRVFAHGSPLDPETYIPDIRQRREKGFIGTTVIGSGIVNKFMN